MTTLAEALAPKSDQLNADDLNVGPRVLKITGARVAKDGRETKIIINYEGDNGRPWKPCKTMGRAMVIAWKITEPEQFIGKSVRVFRDPTVRFGDQGEVGGIRISHMSHLDRTAKVKLTVSQGKKGEFTFSPLVVEASRQTDDGPPDDPAFKWANSYIAKLKTLDTVDAIAAFEAERATKLAELGQKRPDQHERVTKALAARYAAVGDGHSEKRSDADMGEGFTGEPA